MTILCDNALDAEYGPLQFSEEARRVRRRVEVKPWQHSKSQ